MKAHIRIEADDGQVYTGDVELSDGRVSPVSHKRKAEKPSKLASTENINFGLPVVPFIKRYSHFMSGPKRLTLLVARLAEGRTDAQVQRSEVARRWNKMTILMGGRFNSAYEARARENAWIVSPKSGLYTLLPDWKEIFAK